MKLVVVILAILTTSRGTLAEFKLSVLHTNDVHSRFEETNKYGSACTETEKGDCYAGVARRMAAISQVRSEKNETGEPVILLDAGDQFQGTAWFSIFEGEACVYFMNQLGYDAMALGNHEFDNGVGGLLVFLREANFPVISSNINATLETTIQGLFNKSAVLRANGEKIGIVGYTSSSTPDTTPTGSLIFKDEIMSIREEVEKLTSQGINKIIALGHSGIETDITIAEQIPGIDLVVGGHSHTLLYNGDPPPEDTKQDDYPLLVAPVGGGKQVPVVTAYRYGKYLGHIDLVFDDEGDLISWSGNPIHLDSSIEQDQEILDDVLSWKEELDNATSESIGTTLVHLDGSGDSCRLGECNLGNLISDAAIHYYAKTLGKLEVSLFMMNSDSIADSIPEGKVSYDDILKVLPYGDTLDIVELRGETILDAFEHSVAEYETQGRQFSQISGMKVVYDVSKPAQNRVESVEMVCVSSDDDCQIPEYRALDTNKIYKVVVNSYMASGGAGYSIIRDNQLSRRIGKTDVDIITDYIRSTAPIYIGIEGRINFAEDNDCQPDTETGDSATIYQSYQISFFLAIMLALIYNIV